MKILVVLGVFAAASTAAAQGYDERIKRLEELVSKQDKSHSEEIKKLTEQNQSLAKEIEDLKKDNEKLRTEKDEIAQAFSKLLETMQTTNQIAQKLGVTKSPFARPKESKETAPAAAPAATPPAQPE